MPKNNCFFFLSKFSNEEIINPHEIAFLSIFVIFEGKFIHNIVLFIL